MHRRTKVENSNEHEGKTPVLDSHLAESPTHINLCRVASRIDLMATHIHTPSAGGVALCVELLIML